MVVGVNAMIFRHKRGRVRQYSDRTSTTFLLRGVALERAAVGGTFSPELANYIRNNLSGKYMLPTYSNISMLASSGSLRGLSRCEYSMSPLV